MHIFQVRWVSDQSIASVKSFQFSFYSLYWFYWTIFRSFIAFFFVCVFASNLKKKKNNQAILFLSLSIPMSISFLIHNEHFSYVRVLWTEHEECIMVTCRTFTRPLLATATYVYLLSFFSLFFHLHFMFVRDNSFLSYFYADFVFSSLLLELVSVQCARFSSSST